MKTMTLANLRTEVRRRADMENTTFVTDAEVNSYINQSADELWDLLTSADENYGLTSATIAISSGNTLNLPNDFYKLKGVDDITDSANPISLRRFNFTERNDFTNLRPTGGSVVQSYARVMYIISGNQLLFEPPENAIGTYKIWYIPVQPSLTGDSDTLDGISGWTEYVIVDAAIKCRIKEESSIGDLERAKDDLRRRILNSANSRDHSTPETISRTRRQFRDRLLFPYHW